MPRLTKVSRPTLHLAILTAEPGRLHGALTLAAAEAALGARVRVFFQLEAVALLLSPVDEPGDARRIRHGLPSLAAILDDAREIGVELIACQGGLAILEADAAALGASVGVGGPLAFLSGVEAGDRLLWI